ncbi:transcriptional regulator, partial [Listeria monocytogenes]
DVNKGQLLGYGEKIIAIQPDSLRDMLLNELDTIKKHMQNLSS